MELNRQSRNKSTQLWSINLWQRRQEYTREKRQSLHEVLRKTDSHTQINEMRTLLDMMHKNKFKMTQRLKYKT